MQVSWSPGAGDTVSRVLLRTNQILFKILVRPLGKRTPRLDDTDEIRSLFSFFPGTPQLCGCTVFKASSSFRDSDCRVYRRNDAIAGLRSGTGQSPGRVYFLKSPGEEGDAGATGDV